MTLRKVSAFTATCNSEKCRKKINSRRNVQEIKTGTTPNINKAKEEELYKIEYS